MGTHDNHRERMRERFISTGGNGFAPHELLEMLLYGATPRGDTNPAAHALIETFGSLDNVLNASFDDLKNVHGVGKTSAVMIKLVSRIAMECADGLRELETAGDFDTVGRQLITEFRASGVERVFIILLDQKNRILHREFIGEGDFACARVDFRKIAELVLRKSASKVIIAHNHPDGNPNPSASDKATTINLEQFLKQIGVELKEHYIVTDCVYVGMKQMQGA